MFDKIINWFRKKKTADIGEFKELFERFQQILKSNNRIFELMSELEDKLSGEYIFDINYLKHVNNQLSETVYLIVSNLNIIANNRYKELFSRQAAIQEDLNSIIMGQPVMPSDKYIIDYKDVHADMAELTGRKNANLGEIRNRLKMRTPDGFVLSTAVYHRFMTENKLWSDINNLYKQCDEFKKLPTDSYDKEIDRLFEKARMPFELSRMISKHFSSFCKEVRDDPRLAVRSSAFGEDTQGRSFAGQFKSFLCRTCDDVCNDYKKILASRFKAHVVAYSGEKAFDEKELPMAVGVQLMIDARTSGVAYSSEPSGEFTNSMAISGCWGLGLGVVGGQIETDYFRVSRISPMEILDRRIGRKLNRSEPVKSGDIASRPVPKVLQTKACLTDEQIYELADQVLMLERYFRRPLDIEWCFDHNGKLYILQCRPLKLTTKPGKRSEDRLYGPIDAPILMRKKGQVAQRGIAVGRIKQVHDDDNPSDFPVGAVAVTRYTTPRLTSIIRRASAIITNIGSPSGHMATIAREFGVPLIVGTENATDVLVDGTEVTVDAEENIIYQGIVKKLLEYESEGEDVFRDLNEYRILRHLLRRIWPLSLIDPNSSDFTAKNCLTYHDIARFCHEKAVRILIGLNISSQRFRGVESRRMHLDIPLGLQVIDLGGGLSDTVGENVIDSIEKLQSAPLMAILEGLTSPGAWGTDAVQLGFGDLVSSLTRFSPTDRGPDYRGQNLAVISDHYTNMSLRLGYHFNVIDTYVSNNIDDNYIYFRFVGGVTNTERRHLRAILIKKILEKLNFMVTLSGDLVVGRLKKWGEPEILKILFEIGRLIGFTRQLDTRMQSEQSISEGFDDFFKDQLDDK